MRKDPPVPFALAGGRPGPWVPREPLPLRTMDPNARPVPIRPRVADSAARTHRRTHLEIGGQAFGHLKVIERDEAKARGYWWCRCTCGRRVSRTSDFLTQRRSRPLTCDRAIPHFGAPP